MTVLQQTLAWNKSATATHTDIRNTEIETERGEGEVEEGREREIVGVVTPA